MSRRVAIVSLHGSGKQAIYNYQIYILEQIFSVAEYVYILGDVTIPFNLFHIDKYTLLPANGYDVDDLKYIILNFYKEICEYDELIFSNDSYIGPFCDLKFIFSEMDENFFWGITDSAFTTINNRKIEEKRFLQRYFMVIKTEIVLQEYFFAFFSKLPAFRLYRETETEFEYCFSDYLKRYGVEYKVYVDVSMLEPYKKEYRINHLIHESAYLLKMKKIPMVLIESFKVEKAESLVFSFGNNAAETINYLERTTNYPLEYLYEVLIRECNVYDLHNNLCLNVQMTNDIKLVDFTKKTAIIMYLYYEDLFEEKVEFVNQLESDKYHIILVTDEKRKERELRRKIHNVEIRVSSGKGREWEALLVGCHDVLEKYELICFLHDKKSDYLAYKSLGREFESMLWKNMAYDRVYVENIIDYFNRNNQVGLIIPPVANHGIYFDNYSNYWTVCYEKTVQFMKEQKMRSSLLDRSKPPISVGSVFWAKTDVLLKIDVKKLCFDDEIDIDGSINHVLERVIPYVAQEAGYLTVSAYCDEYMKYMFTANTYMLRELWNKVRKSNENRGITFKDYIDGECDK